MKFHPHVTQSKCNENFQDFTMLETLKHSSLLISPSEWYTELNPHLQWGSQKFERELYSTSPSSPNQFQQRPMSPTWKLKN